MTCGLFVRMPTNAADHVLVMPREQASLWVLTQRLGVPESKSSDLEGFCGDTRA